MPRHNPSDVLRQRAVLHEGRRRDELARRGRKHQPLNLTPDQARRLPHLAAHLAAHDGWPPPVSRVSEARRQDLDAMHAAHGALVLLTLVLDALDELPLKGEEMAGLSRAVVDCALEELTLPGTPYAATTQRGPCGGTHAHPVVPLAHLRPEHAALVRAARPGPGGGCDLLGGQAHGVLILDGVQDRRKVAAYISRNPDSRLDQPGTDAYLEALEDELSRKARGGRAPRLSWSRGTVALRRCF
ncbi:hypothetical protein V3W47_19550 [Deinococcus sp. YIM 134068]|uniref:hypothetical protein n=1 Tax=Deinococcus lichenicola TaxID=3118910 RepID=UPI002F95A716